MHEPAPWDVIAALASALQERDRYTGDHSESRRRPDRSGRRGARPRPRGDQPHPHRGAASRHRQGRRPRRDPPQARAAGRPRVGDHAPAPGHRRADPARDPGSGRDRAHRPPRARALGRRGYPDGLAGEEIPIGSRIILACDAYHAMTSDRPYRKAMSHADAMAELSATPAPVRPGRRAGAGRLPVRPPPGGPRRGLSSRRGPRTPTVVSRRPSPLDRTTASRGQPETDAAQPVGFRAASSSLPILKIFVPQSGHVPWIAGRPFFMVTCCGILDLDLLTFLHAVTLRHLSLSFQCAWPAAVAQSSRRRASAARTHDSCVIRHKPAARIACDWEDARPSRARHLHANRRLAALPELHLRRDRRQRGRRSASAPTTGSSPTPATC